MNAQICKWHLIDNLFIIDIPNCNTIHVYVCVSLHLCVLASVLTRIMTLKPLRVLAVDAYSHSFPLPPPRVRKILNLRLFSDENGKAWSKSVMDLNYEVLCVSQFTLQCILKGNKPDFHAAMPSELAQPFYDGILENMRSSYKPELIKGEWRGDSARSLDRLLAFYFPVFPF